MENIDIDENNEYVDPIVPQLLDITDTIVEAVLHMREVKIENSISLLEDIGQGLDVVINNINKLLPKIKIHNNIDTLQKNIAYCYDKLCDLVIAQNFDTFDWKLKSEFTGLILVWRDYITFFLKDCSSEKSFEKMKLREFENQKRMMKICKKDLDKEYKYDVSLVVLFYNNAKMTEECINSIKKYTKGINYELITINNGSNEETNKWANNLSNKKKIHYKYNMPGLGFTVVTMYPELTTEGKYTVYVSNDVIVTKNWLKNLLQCMDSDESIYSAVPVCNSLSNMQTIQVSYKNMDEMQNFAAAYNKHNSMLWEERARLFPFLGIIRGWYNRDIIGQSNYYFSHGMFGDDDYSVKIRRCGFKQILCKDVFVHHYGSATIKDSQFEVMEKGRKQFLELYGVDGWNSLGIESMIYAYLIKEKRENVRILTINPLFGESTLAVKNKFKSLDCKQIYIDAILEDSRYLPDAEAMYNDAALIENRDLVLNDKKYDCIVVNNYIEDSKTDINNLFDIFKNHLAQGGKVYAMTKNYFSYSRMIGMMNLVDINQSYWYDGKYDDKECFISYDVFCDIAKKHGFKIALTTKLSLNVNNVDDVIENINRIVNIKDKNMDFYKDVLNTESFIYELEQ